MHNNRPSTTDNLQKPFYDRWQPIAEQRLSEVVQMSATESDDYEYSHNDDAYNLCTCSKTR